MHVVDGLEEREHGAVVGDASSTHVVALHAVKEGGDSILQCFQKLLVVLLRLSVLILLLKTGTRAKQSTESHLGSNYKIPQPELLSAKVLPYLHYADWLDGDVTFDRLSDRWKGLS